MRSRLHSTLVAAAATAVLLTACASPIADSAGKSGVSFDPPEAVPAAGEVIGTGTVLQPENEQAMFCLGAVAESYPPQCGGPKITNWDWDAADGHEAASGTTWGTYALQGTWDGAQFTLTQPPIMLALYDPMVQPDPLEETANAGDNDDSTLLAVQTAIEEDPSIELLSTWTTNGYLFVTVLYDDGRLQEYLDEVHGEGVVAIRSALRPAEQ